MSSRELWTSEFVALTMLCFAGCGRPSYELEVAPVSGTVTLDGKPLPSGYVVVPTSKGRMASGEIQPDGSFVLTTYEKGDGAQVGTHPVVVNEVPPDEFSRVKRPRGPPIPEKYTRAGTSGLQVDVKADEENFLELQLKSKDE
jgi:hypothetical protein